jgi:hypothetical protein
MPFFLNYNNQTKHFDPSNNLTIHRSKFQTTLEIHAEYFNPMINYHITIACAICELIKKGIINFPDTIFTLPFIRDNLEWFVSMSELEMYFDTKRNDVLIDKKTVETNDLIKIVDQKTYATTYYSNDFRGDGKHYRKSIISIYDKETKDLKDNHIAHEVIKQHPYKTRIEFRLCRSNCRYLSIDNLAGTFDQIFKRYYPYLAILYNSYLNGNVITTERKKYKQLNKVLDEAREKMKTRYTRKELRRSEPVITHSKKEARDQMKHMILGAFLLEQENAENSNKTDQVSMD